ncbi:GH116 family glycosyl hydrolase [Sulfolobus tengchongensis]|uniref:GH116 family glycosyl hydrolase n=1 Tax=Sulfolobus tengchongensis TaxID=207809 RepID=A0AAX4L1Q7_9CREN
MVVYKDTNRIVAGVPLGGIGTGKLEIDNKVRIVNVTIANNWGNPIKRLIGFHVFVKPNDESGFLVQKDSGLTRIREFRGEIIYDGRYPFVFITAKNEKMKINIEAFSPLIPHDLKNSSLPVVGISIRIEGSKNGIIAISMPNIVGSVNIGRVNEKVKDGVVHKNVKANDYDPAKGNTTFISDHVKNTVTQYNLKKRPSETYNYWINQYENEDPWVKLNNGENISDDPHEVTGQRDDPASIIVSEYTEGEEIRYIYSWYFTGKHVFYPYSHYYENFFKNSTEIAYYFMDNFDELRKKSKAWHEEIKGEEWLKDAIINSAYILSSNTWLDEKGRFSIYEAPQNCPLMGTIGTCYEFGSLPVILMFPELEKSFLKLLLSYIRDDGYVPHDLGYHSLDSPIDGTTAPPKWKDMNPTFILLVYRYFKFTRDIEFLKEAYPVLVKVMDWELKQCKDGLPFLEGEMDNAFDATIIKGHDSYTSSVFIASLIAMKEISRIVNDNKYISLIEGKLREARESFKRMFNGKHFKAWDGLENASFIAQIFGEWWTTLLELEPITDEDIIKKALESIVKLNGNASPYCVPNLVNDNGKIIDISVQTYSSWPRMTFAMCWLAYKKGIDKSLSLCRKEWENIVKNGLVWDQPSRINARTGKPEPNYLDHYIGSPSLWSFLF